MVFLPELVFLFGALVLFAISLGDSKLVAARITTRLIAISGALTALATVGCRASLFNDAYLVDAYSQWLKVALSLVFLLVVSMDRQLPDIREDVKPEYYLFLTLSVTGLIFLVSCQDLLALIIALELSSFPLYFLVPMRREREGQRSQMESAIKYIMYGIVSMGVMLFGVSYLFGLTGTTFLPVMLQKLAATKEATVATVGLAMLFAGLLYKLAIFPFHFWTPDVYEGASHETAGFIASAPKVGAVAVLVRFTSLTPATDHVTPTLLASLAVASMFYGNLVALMQEDLKRLFGFSGIAHAGYAVLGFVALNTDGYTASLYYILGYALMVLACFLVISWASNDGMNLKIADLAGLHRRSPLLAATLLVGVFALAGLPPFAGFMGKFALLKAALAKGYLALVILAMLNAAIAVYYYLVIVREACFRDPGDRPAITLSLSARFVCVVLILAIIGLGVAPNAVFQVIAQALPQIP